MKKIILLSCLIFSPLVNGETPDWRLDKSKPADIPIKAYGVSGEANALLNAREIITLPRQYWYDFYNKFVDLNSSVAALAETNNQLTAQVKKLEIQNSELCAETPKTILPINGWCYYEKFGWVYMDKEMYPWFFVNTPNYSHMGHEVDFQLVGWCFLDTTSEDTLIYCYATEKWHIFE